MVSMIRIGTLKKVIKIVIVLYTFFIHSHLFTVLKGMLGIYLLVLTRHNIPIGVFVTNARCYKHDLPSLFTKNI